MLNNGSTDASTLDMATEPAPSTSNVSASSSGIKFGDLRVVIRIAMVLVFPIVAMLWLGGNAVFDARHKIIEEQNHQTLSGQAVDSVNRLRKLARDSVSTGTTGGITGKQWFDTITAMINLMKNVEDRFAGDLIALTDKLGAHANEVF